MLRRETDEKNLNRSATPKADPKQGRAMLRRETDGKNLNRSATPKAGPKQEQVMLRRETDGKSSNRSATSKAGPKQGRAMLRRKTGIKKFNAIRIRGEPNPSIRIPDFFTSRSRPEDSTDVRRDPDDRPKPAFPLLPPSAFSLFAGVPIFAATCPMPPSPPAGGIAAAPMADAPRRAGLRRQKTQDHDHHRAERRPRRASVRRSAFRVPGRTSETLRLPIHRRIRCKKDRTRKEEVSQAADPLFPFVFLLNYFNSQTVKYSSNTPFHPYSIETFSEHITHGESRHDLFFAYGKRISIRKHTPLRRRADRRRRCSPRAFAPSHPS